MNRPATIVISDWLANCRTGQWTPFEAATALKAALTKDGYVIVSKDSMALDVKSAHAAAEAICDYADHNLTMFDACCDETPQGARDIFEAAKRLRDLLAPSVPRADRASGLP